MQTFSDFINRRFGYNENTDQAYSNALQILLHINDRSSGCSSTQLHSLLRISRLPLNLVWLKLRIPFQHADNYQQNNYIKLQVRSKPTAIDSPKIRP